MTNTERTAAQLKAALTAAAAVMVVPDAPERERSQQQGKRSKQRPARNWTRLAPLAAAAGVIVIAAGTVIGTHLARHTGTGAATGTTPTTPQPPRPEFYLTVTYPTSGQNVLQFQVRRTNGGAVTGSRTIPAANVGWGGYLTAGAGDRTFYFSRYPCSTTIAPQTTFDRITITGSGQISGFAPAARPVPGMVTTFAVSPDGSQMAYNALPGVCTGKEFRSTAAASVSVDDLSTGAIKTWQDLAASTVVSRVSWASDDRTLIVDERSRGPQRDTLTVFALNTTTSGGSLQAHSTTLLQQHAACATCDTSVAQAVAGPHGTLTEIESQVSGQGIHVLIISVPAKPGSRPTVLYREPNGAPGSAANNTDLFTDSSGQWPLLWPAGSLSARDQAFVPAGWISDGRLHPLPGLAQIFPQGIAW